MPNYHTAYYLKQLRQFPGWHEDKYQAQRDESGTDDQERKTNSYADEPPDDDTVVFLHDDLTVTKSCFNENDVLFNEVSPDWEAFCRNKLKFAVPDWEAESARVREKLAEMESQSSDAGEPERNDLG